MDSMLKIENLKSDQQKVIKKTNGYKMYKEK